MPVERHRGTRHVQLVLTVFAVLLLAGILVALLVDRHSSSWSTSGSGVAATQTRSLPAFRALDLTGANNVIVRVGTTRSVTVHADSNLLDRVTTTVRAGRLIVGTTPGSLNAKAPMFVTVTVPSLDAITLQGAGNINVVGINSRSLTVTLPGAGTIHATGATSHLAVTIGGMGTALLGNLIARDANAAVSGDGSITLTATRGLSASISGSGTILYGGHPQRVTKTVTGSGSIIGG
jgi:hypothetical protein